MIQGIDEVACIGCRLCDYVCQTDVFDSTEGVVQVKYPGDCYNCMECVFLCPTDAIVFGPGVPRKFDIRARWQQIKDAVVESRSEAATTPAGAAPPVFRPERKERIDD